MYNFKVLKPCKNCPFRKDSLKGWLLVAFIPNKQTGLILGAVYIGQETLESIASNELVKDSVEILKLEVKEYLNSKKQE